jgi:hypothetical protein
MDVRIEISSKWNIITIEIPLDSLNVQLKGRIELKACNLLFPDYFVTFHPVQVIEP